MESQATHELKARLIELYGISDYASVAGIWQSNPASVPVDGSWGLSHAAQTLLQLEVRRALGASAGDLIQLVDEQVARWYAREAIARCSDGIVDWMNPLKWSEDSRLDYMAVVLFADWYLSQL